MAKGKKDKKKAAPKAKSKPVAKKAAKPAKKAVAKKAAKPVAKAKAKPVVKKAIKPAVAPKKVEKPVKKVVEKVAPKVVAKPAPVVKPNVKEVAKKDASNVAKPLYKTNNTMKKTEPEVTKELNLRYSDAELKEFKDLIEKKLVDAREELKNLKETLDNHTESQAGNKAWNMEEGTDTSEMEYLMNQISRLHQYIRNLELALVRVENKTYGICRVTGKLIPKERLRMVPHATLSLEAKLKRKSDDVSPGAALASPPSDFSEGFED